jgi:hypothetical protein
VNVLASIRLLFVLFCTSVLATAQQTPDGLQLNVPYECSNGVTYVVHRCETGPKGEFCFYQAPGQSERYNTRQGVVYQMTQMCKVKGPTTGAGSAPAQRPSDLNNSRWDCGGGTSLTVIQCQRQAGQEACFIRLEQDGKFVTQAPKPRSEIEAHVSACKPLPQFNPAYLAEFPSPYRVVQGMLASNPRDNAIRAIGAYYQLSEIIKVLSGPRETSGFLPDEKQFIGDYGRLQSEMAHAAAKMFPGQQFDLASNPYHYKRSDPRFGFEGIPVWTTFLSPGAQQQFARIVGGNDENYMLAIQREKNGAMQQVQNDMKAQQADAGYAKDPGSVAMRHCVESGRSEMECLGEGMRVGAFDLMGGNPLKGIVPETPVGLRLTGVYSEGDFSLTFDQATVGVACGPLIPQKLPYSVERSGNRLSVKIPISPKPITLSYQESKLTGPGPVDVAGLVDIGGVRDSTSTSYEMQSQTTTAQRQITANDVSNYSADQIHQNGMEYSVDQQSTSTTMVPTTKHHYGVPTAPKTERCNAGTLPPKRETPSVTGALTQVVGSKASKSSNTQPGLRLNGTYAVPGGLKIEFRGDSATLECGEAFHSEGYAVLPQGNELIVMFQNDTGPLSLLLQPSGSLTGSGNIDVAGRRAIQSNSGVDYLPRNARCTLGTFEPAK